MVITPEILRELVVKSKLIDLKKFDEVVEFCESTGRSVYTELAERGLATNDALGKLEADYLKLPFVILSKSPIPEDVFATIPERLARKMRVVVFARDGSGIKLAMADPTKKDIPDMIAKKTGAKVFVYYATKTDIETVLRLFKRDLQKTIDILLKTGLNKPHAGSGSLDDPPVANIVDLLLDAAFEEKASDVHIEPQETHAVIRLRIDGMLHDVLRVSKYINDRIITRIKVLSNLRTDEHMSAQDGKMKILIGEERVDIRVSIVPIAEGEKAVLRLLTSKNRNFTLSDLGMNDVDLEKVTRAFTKSYGMILSTGPTGSGKTTSIYAILKILNTPEKNITTVEDPVEYRISGANQIQVNPKTNLTFASGLRSILRQDPNIIFVGEIRDNETAGIAVNAALTGHLVLSTLHTNDAATALPRLMDMKIEPFLVASTVNVIIAQRLVRKICDHCKAPTQISMSELEKSFPPEVLKRCVKGTHVTIYKGTGCKVCRSIGYSGRIGLFEVLEITPQIRKLIVEKAGADAITTAAIADGMTTMVDDGLKKVVAGSTSLDEILRVTKTEFT